MYITPTDKINHSIYKDYKRKRNTYSKYIMKEMKYAQFRLFNKKVCSLSSLF